MFTQMLRIREFEERVKRSFEELPGLFRGHTHLGIPLHFPEHEAIEVSGAVEEYEAARRGDPVPRPRPPTPRG
jgi:hypothetical protein